MGGAGRRRERGRLDEASRRGFAGGRSSGRPPRMPPGASLSGGHAPLFSPANLHPGWSMEIQPGPPPFCRSPSPSGGRAWPHPRKHDGFLFFLSSPVFSLLLSPPVHHRPDPRPDGQAVQHPGEFWGLREDVRMCVGRGANAPTAFSHHATPARPLSRHAPRRRGPGPGRCGARQWKASGVVFHASVPGVGRLEPDLSRRGAGGTEESASRSVSTGRKKKNGTSSSLTSSPSSVPLLPTL